MAGGKGTVYLLHFAPGLRVTGRRYARHYIGWAQDVQARVAQHQSGNGSPLVAAAVRKGLSVRLARTWPDTDRHFERRLKRQRNAPRMCPLC